MKSLLIFLFPILLFAQNPYPDTLYLIDGRSFPCLITYIEGSKVTMIYANKVNESVLINAIEKITMKKYGEVYSTDLGYTTDVDAINEFAGLRLKKLKEKEIVETELKKFDPDSNIVIDNINGSSPYSVASEYISINNKWSFGILFMPYYSGRRYSVTRSSFIFPADAYSYNDNGANMEGQFTYGVAQNIRLTLNAGYSFSHSEIKDETTENFVNYYVGSFDKTSLNILNFRIGVKYYLTNIFRNRVSIYALTGIGKQFAFVKYTHEYLPESQHASITYEDNVEEYLQDLNSPLYFSLGFGVEYFFNESLSLTSIIGIL